MLRDFDDFCLWTYVVINELWQRLGPLVRRPGPAPVCSDSELLTMAIVGECRGWDVETELLGQWQAHRDLFSHLPSQSRFNRRRRQLAEVCNLVRRAILGLLDVAQDRPCVIDRLPIPVMAFHVVPGSAATGDWKAARVTSGARGFGKHQHVGTRTKKQTIFGDQPRLLLTMGGVILDFELAPDHVSDLSVGQELLADHTERARSSRRSTANWMRGSTSRPTAPTPMRASVPACTPNLRSTCSASTSTACWAVTPSPTRTTPDLPLRLTRWRWCGRRPSRATDTIASPKDAHCPL